MPATVEASVEVGVWSLGKITIPVHLEKLGQSIGFLPPEIEGRFLGVAFANGTTLELRSPGNRLLCSGKLFFEQ